MARIAIILGRLAVGGATAHAIDEVLHLKDRHEVLLITGLPEEHELNASYLLNGFTGFEHQMIPGFFRTRKIWKHWKTCLAVRKILLQFKPDVVHTHTPVAGFIGRMAAAQLGVKCIIHSYHGLLFKGYFPAWQSNLLVLFERWLAGKSHLLLALSPGQKNELVTQYHIAPENKVWCVPIGVDVALFAQSNAEQTRNAFRADYHLTPSDFVLGMVGRLVPIKNHRLGLLAFRQLQAKFPQIKLVIVGDGPLRQSLINYCEELGLAYSSGAIQSGKPTSVYFVSWQKKMYEVMAALDAVLLTSESEGTPICVMEAMASGKPVISTKVGGVPEMIDNMVDGLLVEKGDLETLVVGLSQLVGDRVLTSQLGAKAKAKAIATFNKTNGLNLLEKRLKDCFNS
jgi:glycosyltransferase involved in cell wall biosynthesis